MPSFGEHPRAVKDLEGLPRPVQQTFRDVVRAALAEGLRPKPREIITYRRGRRFWIYDAVYLKVHYRMAVEIDGGDAFIWAYGAHESFYKRMERRAGV